MMLTDSKTRWQAVMIFFLVILSLNGFYAKVVISTPLKHLCFAYMLGAIALSMPYFFKFKHGFVFPVQLISFSILISMFVTFVTWKQGFSHSLSTIPYMLWFVFFYLLNSRIPFEIIEKIVFFFGWMYIVLFLFQFTHSSQVYFGFREEFKEDRGVVRILFPGAGVFFFAYFYALNRVMEQIKYRWTYVLFLLAGVVVTVLQVTKQSIALLLLITIFHLLRKVSLIKKLVVMGLSIAVIIVTLNSDNPISQGIIESQKENVSDGDQNIRVMAAEYFVGQFSPNTLSRIMGNGFPNLNSTYGQYVTMLEDNYSYYLTDIGVVGMYAMFGILPLLAYGLIFFKGLFMPVPPEFQYLKYYLFYLLATCLTSDAIFSVSFLVTNVFMLYAYQLIYERRHAEVKHYLVSIAA